MISVWVVTTVVVLAAFVREALSSRSREILKTQNSELRTKLLEQEGSAKREKLEAKLADDEKAGSENEAKFKAFVAAHPDIFPPDGKR